MSRSDSLHGFAKLLKDAIRVSDWGGVATARERLAELMVEATIDGSPDELQLIESSLAGGFAEMILEHGVSPSQSTPEANAWMMRAESRLASIALRRRPPPPPPIAGDGLAVRDRILKCLASGNGRRLSNVDIARKCGAAVETIARIMPNLRSEGLVRTRRIGPRKINEITDQGRSAALGVSAGGIQDNLNILNQVADITAFSIKNIVERELNERVSKIDRNLGFVRDNLGASIPIARFLPEEQLGKITDSNLIIVSHDSHKNSLGRMPMKEVAY